MSAPRSRLELLWLPLVLAALLLVYLPGVDNPPIFDDAYLADGSLLKEYGSLTEPRARAISYGSFVWIQQAFGEGLWKQRVANLLIHLGVVIGLWAFYRELLPRVEPPASVEGERAEARSPLERSAVLGFGIAFFALNPVAVYAVAYVIQRSILMATFFVVVGLWAFARGCARGKAGYHVLALACYALAVASKEHAVLAPLAALPVYILVARPSVGRLGVIAVFLAAAIAGVGWLLWSRYGNILGQAFDEFSRVYLLQLAQLDPQAPARAFPLSILNQSYLFFEYGFRWMLPYAGWMSINLRPPFPLGFASFPHILGAIGYAAVVTGGFFLVIRFRDWRALAGLSILVPALLFATEFATVWVQDPFVLYRSYLWAIGIPGLVFCLLQGTPPKIMLGAGIVVGGLISWQALDRVLSMDSAERAWTDAIAKLPNDPRAVGRWFPYLNRGIAYLDREEYALARHDFEVSSTLGDMGMGSYNLGAVLAADGKHAQALAAFDQAEKQGYNLYNLPFQRGLSLLATGRPTEAYRQFEATRALTPPSPTRELLLLNLGRTGLQLGKADAAVRDLEQLVSIDPRHKEGRYLLAMALISRNEHERAKEMLSALIAEDATGPAFYGRALANFGLRRKSEALADIDEAIRRDPANPHLQEWRKRIAALAGPA